MISDKIGIFDFGGLASFIITLLWLLFLIAHQKIHSDILSKFKKTSSFRKITLIPLLFIGFVSLWSTIRVTLYFVKIYIFGTLYKTDDVLLILSWLLTTNLIFTLFNALIIDSEGEYKSEKNIAIKGMLDVSIQALIIGVITFLPRNSNQQLIYLGGALNYLFILIGLVVSLAILFYLKERSRDAESGELGENPDLIAPAQG